LADGKMSGVVTNALIRNGVCNFTGNYSISSRDSYFVWNAKLINCQASDSTFNIIKQLFCASAGPTYSQSNFNFTAGCFAAFNPSCTQLQFTTFSGQDGGADGQLTWDFFAPAPFSRPSAKVNTPPICSLEGVSSSTIHGLPFPRYQYQHTTFNITYHQSSYVSRATYDDKQGTSCFVEWKGEYMTSNRLESYPSVTLYPYSSSSNKTVSATSGPCASYLYDPASCTFLTASSQQRHDCFIVWDSFVSAPSCTYFRLFGHESTSSDASGPTFQVVSRKPKDDGDHGHSGHTSGHGHDGDDDDDNNNHHGNTSGHGKDNNNHGKSSGHGHDQHLMSERSSSPSMVALNLGVALLCFIVMSLSW